MGGRGNRVLLRGPNNPMLVACWFGILKAGGVITEVGRLARRLGGSDIEVLSRYLESCRLIAHGDITAGPIALAPPSERFHWLTAPRSDVIQSGPVHEGLCEDPESELDRLFREIVLQAGNG